MQNIIGLLNVSFAPIIYIYENRSMFYIYKRLHMIQHLVVKFQSHSLCPKTEKMVRFGKTEVSKVHSNYVSPGFLIYPMSRE